MTMRENVSYKKGLEGLQTQVYVEGFGFYWTRDFEPKSKKYERAIWVLI